MKTATLVGVFALGLVIGGLAAPWLDRSGITGDARRYQALMDELESEMGADALRAAIERADERVRSTGLY